MTTRSARLALTVATCIGLAHAALAGAHAVPPTETDPRKIMEAVEGRPLGDKSKGRFTMLIQTGGKERTRTVSIQAIENADSRRTLLFFEEPADLRNTGLLTHDWNSPTKEDDQWLYLPALAKSTRITGAGKAGSFLGSDLSFSDMTRRNPADFDYAMVTQSVDVASEDTWLIEATPKNDRARNETGYLKASIWVSKSKLMPLQIQAWLVDGKRTKRLKAMDLKQIDGIWTAFRIVIRTEKGDKLVSQTDMRWLSLAHGQASVVPEDFATGRLEKGL